MRHEPRASARWTEDDIAALCICADDGFSTAATARILGRSQASIWQKAGQLGISFHGKSGAPLGNRNRAAGLNQIRA